MSANEPAKKGGIGCFGIAAIIGLCLFLYVAFYPEQAPEADPNKTPQSASARELKAAFASNEISARARFENAPLTIDGEVYSVEGEEGGSAIVMLDDGAGGVVALKFAPADAVGLAAWSKGMRVKASCTTVYYLLNVVTPQGCKPLAT